MLCYARQGTPSGRRCLVVIIKLFPVSLPRSEHSARTRPGTSVCAFASACAGSRHRSSRPAHTGDIYNGELVAAVKRFQARHGLGVDGIVGDNTVAQLNVSAAERVRQLELNMERRRWMEDDLGDYYVFVNLADQYPEKVKAMEEELRRRWQEISH